MKNHKRNTFELLFNMLSIQDPSLLHYKNDWFNLFDLCQKWYSSEGNNGVKRMKNHLTFLSSQALGEPLPAPLSFTKSRDGIPVTVIPIMPYSLSIKGKSKSDARKLTCVLSLCRFPDLFLGKPTDRDVSEQLGTISTPMTSKVMDVIDGVGRYKEAGFREFLIKFFEFYKTHPITKSFLKRFSLDGIDESGVYVRNTAGPNGPLLESSHKDSSVLDREVNLKVNLYNLQSEIGKKCTFSFRPTTVLSSGYTTQIRLEDADSYLSWTSGKLTVLPEKAGKLRIIAMPDYYTQLSLKPVHDYLARILKCFPTDYTYDQQASYTQLADWTRTDEEERSIASFDHSSCTDLFPFEFQLEILRRFQTPLFVESYRNVMVQRNYSIKMPTSKQIRQVTWNTGQPMGALSSWPLMAVSHHMLVLYAHWRSHGKKFPKALFDKYCILGDDIVIADKATSTAYLKLTRDLGMKINLTKSHISQGKDLVAEFAKVIVWNGHIIHVIKPTQCSAAISNWRLAVPLLLEYKNNAHFKTYVSTMHTLIDRYFPRGRRVLLYLLSTPSYIGGLDFRIGSYNSLIGIKAGPLHPLLAFVAIKSKSIITREKVLYEGLTSGVTNYEIRRYLIGKEAQKSVYLGPLPSTRFLLLEFAKGNLEVVPSLLVKQATPDQPPWADKRKEAIALVSLWEQAINLVDDYSIVEVPDPDTGEVKFFIHKNFFIKNLENLTVSQRNKRLRNRFHYLDRERVQGFLGNWLLQNQSL